MRSTLGVLFAGVGVTVSGGDTARVQARTWWIIFFAFDVDGLPGRKPTCKKCVGRSPSYF